MILAGLRAVAEHDAPPPVPKPSPPSIPDEPAEADELDDED